MASRLRALVAALALVGGQVLAVGVLTPVAAAAPAGARFFTASLTGPAETPPVATSANGSASFVIATDARSIDYAVSYAGLSGPPIASHIHLGAVGVPGPIILPLTIAPGDGSSGSFFGRLTAANLDMTAGITSFADAVAAIRAGMTYVNIHTAANPHGEIRGQLVAASHQPSFVVTADRPFAVPAGHNWSFNDYFPRSSTVTVGTTVAFENMGFHTFTFLPKSISVKADRHANGVARSDADDVTANTNGTSHTIFNVAGLLPSPMTCGSLANPCTFDGSSVVSGGAPLGGPTGPFAVTFTASPGTYLFHCRVHPFMVGTIRIVPARASGLTTDASAEASAARQASALVTAGFAAEARATQFAMAHDRAHVKVVVAGTSGAGGHVSIQEFLPKAVSLVSGDEVVWKPLDVNEPHTVTFPGELFSDLVPYCANDVPATPAHIPPQGPTDFTCPGGAPIYEIEFGGGNGVRTITTPSTVADSGIIGRVPTLPFALGLPRTAILGAWSATFDPTSGTSRPVTFTYVCQIHEGMMGTVTVP
ncbi:MAG TPA: CHRD domain-containing protein [Candidatus Limnocylindrales bacterium]